jgi:hypothetical protein
MNTALIHMLPAEPSDADRIAENAPRLHEFGPPPWRSVEAMNAAVVADNLRALLNPSPSTAFLLAVDADGTRLGFVTTRTDRDYFLEMAVGHVVDLVVIKAGEGRGVGRAVGDSRAMGKSARLPLVDLERLCWQ